MKSEISIVIPNFNRNKLFVKTLDSIRSQSINNWRCIIVDDGSEEETLNALKKYIQNDSRFELFSRDRKPKGANTCRNIGLSQVKTDWVMFFDSDDLMMPRCLEKRNNAIEKNKNKDFLLFQGATFSNGQITGLRNNAQSKDYIKEIIRFNCALSTPSAVWKTSSLREITGWDERIFRWQDPELFIRALQNNLKFKWISEVPDHLIRVDTEIRITDSITKFNDLDVLIKIFCKIHESIENQYKSDFSHSIHWYCLKASYYISQNQKNITLNHIQKHNILRGFKLYKFLCLMHANNRFKNIKFIKVIIHLFIVREFNNFKNYPIYKDEKIIELFKEKYKSDYFKLIRDK